MARLEKPARFNRDFGVGIADEGVDRIGPNRTRILRQDVHLINWRKPDVRFARHPTGPDWRRHSAMRPGFQLPGTPSVRRPCGVGEEARDRRFVAEMAERGESGKLHSGIIAVSVFQDERQILDGQTAAPVRQGRQAGQRVADSISASSSS